MRSSTILLATVLLTGAAPLRAQSGADGTGASGAAHRSDSRDLLDNPRLGLLGLLGLAGLLRLMRREPNIHVDARRGGQAKDED